MANEEIYYMFSRRTPSLQQSEPTLIPPSYLLMYFSTELRQQDRLLDRLVYLNVLNIREIRLTLLHNPRPRTSAILLLAALLRVSDCFGSTYLSISYLPSRIPIDSPSIFVLILSTLHGYFMLSILGRACSHHLLEMHSASMFSLRFPSAQDRLWQSNLRNSSFTSRQASGRFQTPYTFGISPSESIAITFSVRSNSRHGTDM